MEEFAEGLRDLDVRIQPTRINDIDRVHEFEEANYQTARKALGDTVYLAEELVVVEVRQRRVDRSGIVFLDPCNGPVEELAVGDVHRRPGGRANRFSRARQGRIDGLAEHIRRLRLNQQLLPRNRPRRKRPGVSALRDGAAHH